MTIKHDYFGILETEHLDSRNDVVWEKEITFKNQMVSVILGAKSKDLVTEAQLDLFANILQNLSKFDEVCQKQMITYINEYEDFITHHLEIEDSAIIENLGNNPTVDKFVKAMSLYVITFWAEECIIFEYMLDPENSDQILMVRFDKNGDFEYVDWVS